MTAAASNDDLDHAFRGLVRQLHPDTRTPSESDAEADQRPQEIPTAYATLRDPIRRAAYDRTRAKPATADSAPPLQPQSRPRRRPPRRSRSSRRSGSGQVRWEPPPQEAPPPAASRAGRPALHRESGHDGSR